MSTYELPGETSGTPPPHISSVSSVQAISTLFLDSSVRDGKFGVFPQIQSPARFSDSLYPRPAHTSPQLDELPAASALTGDS